MSERERERDTLKLPRGFHGQSVRIPGLDAIIVEAQVFSFCVCVCFGVHAYDFIYRQLSNVVTIIHAF